VSKGQLGFDLLRQIKDLNIEYLGIDRDEVDITKIDQLRPVFDMFQPTHIIHCAAYTQVDKAEEDKESCYQANVIGTKNLVQLSKEKRCTMVYISTDYVFDGQGTQPFDINVKPNPINYYGYTKYLGEKIVQNELKKFFIVRTSWVFGINGNNFVKTMLNLKDKELITVVDDQIGSPTYTADLASFLLNLILTENYGVYHATNEGYCSWYEFAVEIFSMSGITVNLKPIPSSEYPTKAKRPFNSRLIKNGAKMNHWKVALKNYLKELNND